MASNKTNRPWVLNRLALVLLIVLMIVVGFIATWFILKNTVHTGLPGSGTPQPPKHTLVVPGVFQGEEVSRL